MSNSPVFDQSLDTEIPVIQITESSLPPSTPTSPLNACPEEDPFQTEYKEEQTCYLQVPSSDEDSDENDIISVEQNFTNDSNFCLPPKILLQTQNHAPKLKFRSSAKI